MKRALLIGLLVVAAACGGGGGGGGSDDGATDDTDQPQGDALTDIPTEAPTPELPVTVESADGRQVTVGDVSRIVPLWGNISEVVFDLGLGDNVVARDVSTTFEDASDLPLVTRAHDVSAESVLSLRPTVVLADTDSGPPEALEQIRNVGIPVIVFEQAERVDQIADRIRTIAAALGVTERGEELADATDAEIAAIRAELPDTEAERVAFLYMRGQAGVYLLGGPGSGPDSMIESVGAVDAGTAMGLDQAFTPITSEAMVNAAPDVILMTTTGLESVGGIDGLVQIPGIAQTPAGQNRRVITVEDGLLYSFGARTPEALQSIADQLHGNEAGSSP